MLPTSAGVKPEASSSPVEWRIQLSYWGRRRCLVDQWLVDRWLVDQWLADQWLVDWWLVTWVLAAIVDWWTYTLDALGIQVVTGLTPGSIALWGGAPIKRIVIRQTWIDSQSFLLVLFLLPHHWSSCRVHSPFVCKEPGLLWPTTTGGTHR